MLDLQKITLHLLKFGISINQELEPVIQKFRIHPADIRLDITNLGEESDTRAIVLDHLGQLERQLSNVLAVNLVLVIDLVNHR